MKAMRTFLSVIALLALAVAVPAQEQTSVTGSVKDSQGAVLPGATITVKNVATGLTRVGYSSGEGRFSVTGLPPGTYEVTVQLQGFADYKRTDLRLVIGTAAPIAVTLNPAGVEQAITVSGERTIVETTESDISTAISEELIENLPIPERNAITLALLVPGVSASPYFDPTKSRDNFDGFSFGAGSGSENLILVDGGDNNDDVVGSILQFYPQDSIQEFEVITSRFKAEYGHTDGGVVNMITKSGTNDFSGGGYWLFRDDSLNRKTFVEEDADADKAEFRQNILGGYAGGPIAKDKAFFFGNLDYTDRPSTVLTNTGGIVPEVDAQGQVGTGFDQTLLVAKVTANLNDSNFFTGRYAYQDDGTENINLLPTDSVDHAGIGTNVYHAFLVKDQTVIGSDKLNEAFYQFNRFTNEIVSNADGTPRERHEIILENTYQLGHNINHPQRTDQDKHQFVDNFSWRMSKGGDHDFKAGIEYQHVSTGGLFSTGDAFASFSYGSAADYEAGRRADQVTVFNGPLFFVGESSNNIWALYLQDDWKPADNLTLNLGLRYDIETNDWNQQNRTFISADPLFFGGQPDTDTNNIGPRIGFAYDINGEGKYVARGGYGLYYQQIFWNSPIRAACLECELEAELFFEGADVTFDVDDPFCEPGAPAPGCIPVAPVPGADAANFVGRSFTAVHPNLETPYSHQFSMGVGSLLPHQIGLDVDYVYSRSNNQIYRTRTTTTRTEFDGLSTENFGPRASLNVQGAESTYHGLLLSGRRSFGDMSMQMSYTYSRAKGTVDRQTERIVVDDDAGFDRNFGPTDAQRDHVFSGSLFYTFPHEFQVGAIFKFQSGYAFTGFDSTLGDDDFDNSSSDTIAGHGTRNSNRGDGFSQVDLRVAKKFTIAERFRPQVFFEVFNLFNSRNEKPDSVVSNVNSAAFGTSSQVAGQPFQAQISLRFDF